MHKAALVAIEQLWDAANVGHKGAFSADRLLQLRSFMVQSGDATRSSAWMRTAAVALLTPLPCLLLLLVSESLPLASPRDGPKTNGAFWLRVWLVQGCYTYAFFMLALYCIPELPRRFRRLVPISAVVSAAYTAVYYATASTLGFPVPFSSLVLATPWVIFLIVALWLYIGPVCRSTSVVYSQLKKFGVMMCVGSSLAIVYPTFYYCFLLAKENSHAQVLLTVLVLPVIKFLEKLLLYQVTRHLPDIQPVCIAFNVEVFNGLFTSSCTGQTISTTLTVVLMTVDLLSSIAALYRLHNLVERIDELSSKAGSEVTRVRRVAAAFLLLSDANNSAKPRDEVSGYHVSKLSGDFVKPRRITRLSATITPLSVSSSIENFGYRGPLSAKKSLTKIVVGGKQPVRKKASSNNTVEPIKSVLPLFEPRDPTLPSKRVLQDLSVEERQRFVLETCRVLRRAETLLVVEYIEVIVPVLYASYIAMVYYLPNRAYFSNLRDLSEAELVTTVKGVLFYAALQLMSLVLAILQLSRRVQLAPCAQLHFTLKNEMMLVQSTLTLWVMYVLQTSLDHTGTDYTFKFEWLSKK